MRELYPEIEPYNSFNLTTESNHKVYIEEVGNVEGIPVIFLHGGPGSGCNQNHRRYFDPQKYRVVIFDQRGCNRSTPQGDTTSNTTQLILGDMESIRKRLDIDSWLLFGGSWGATLALLYAQSFPEKVRGIILRGTFLARQQDLNWFIREGANRLLPDEWERLLNAVPVDKHNDLIKTFYEVLHGKDHSKKLKAARAWSRWATRIVTFNLTTAPSESDNETDDEKLLNEVSIETHYAFHRYFIDENQILDNVSILPDVPVHIIHGRKDITCLMDASWKIHKKLPHSTLEILPEAGHLAGEAAIIDALVRATDKFATMPAK